MTTPFHIFIQGGFAMYPLLLCSVITLAVVLERLYFLWGTERHLNTFQNSIIDPLVRGERQQILAVARTSRALPAQAFVAALTSDRQNPAVIEGLLGQKRSDMITSLKRYLWILGTIGASAPFIGLFGTVLGIIRSFHSMATTGSGGFDVVAAGISEALIATAAGLVVAVIAVVAYNYFTVRVNRLSTQIRDTLQQFLTLFGES